jgi:hypothetical protein
VKLIKPSDLVIYQENEWSALYVEGKLDIVGDHYLIEERVYQFLEIDVRQSNSFMLGGNSR